MELLNLQSSLQSEIQAKAAISEELSRTRADLIAAQKYAQATFERFFFFQFSFNWSIIRWNHFAEIYAKIDRNGTQWAVKLSARITKSVNYSNGWKWMKAVSVAIRLLSHYYWLRDFLIFWTSIYLSVYSYIFKFWTNKTKRSKLVETKRNEHFCWVLVSFYLDRTWMLKGVVVIRNQSIAFSTHFTVFTKQIKKTHMTFQSHPPTWIKSDLEGSQLMKITIMKWY